MDKPVLDIGKQLKYIRLLHKWMWIVFIGYIPFMLLGLFFFERLLGEYAGETLFALWGCLLFVVSFKLDMSKCPRCNQKFHSDFLWSNPYTKKCVHCELSLDD